MFLFKFDISLHKLKYANHPVGMTQEEEPQPKQTASDGEAPA